MSAVLKLIAAVTGARSLFRWIFIAVMSAVAIKSSSSRAQRRETALAILRLVCERTDLSDDPQRAALGAPPENNAQ